MDDEDEVILWVYGRLTELKDEGFVKDGAYLTIEGYKEYMKLIVAGFIPDINKVISCIQVTFPEYTWLTHCCIAKILFEGVPK